LARGNKPAGTGIDYILALLGLAGLFAAIVVALITLFGSTSAAFAATAVYCAGVVAMTVITGGARLARLPLWILRLAAPLAGAALVLVVMLALGAG